MVGASKILTVSYGTFSCTLEGFDDPFSTMRSIAEYFRDLAADDRYFGAEPPTPDAEMLHRIAEREIQQRVEAKVSDGGVVLRQVEAPDSATEPEAIAPAPVVETPVDPEPMAEAHESTEPAPVMEAPVAPAPVEDAVPGETIADKLSRIRAAVASGAAATAAAGAVAAADADDGDEEDRSSAEDVTEPVAEAEDFEDDVESDIAEAFADVAEADTDAPYDDVPEEMLAEEMLADAVAEDSEGLPETALSEEPAAIADEGEAVADDATVEDQPEDVADEAAAEDVEEEISSAAEDAFGDEASAEEATDHPEDVAPLMEQSAFADTVTEDSEADAFEQAADAAEDPAQDEVAIEDTEEEALPAAAGALNDDEEDLDDDAFEEAIDAPTAMEKIVPLVPEDAAAEEMQDDDVLAEAAEPLRLDDTVAVSDQTSTDDYAETLGETSLSEEDETELLNELAAIGSEDDDIDESFDEDLGDFEDDEDDDAMVAEAEPAPEVIEGQIDETEDLVTEEASGSAPDIDDAIAGAMAAHTDGRDRPSGADEAQGDAAFDRILEETNSKLDESEGSRRRSAIAHLKAAVAATKADRLLKRMRVKEEAEQEEQSQYRDDLAQVVRPRRPENEGTETSSERPKPIAESGSPLMLVSEQRVGEDDDDAEPSDGIRPRRVTSRIEDFTPEAEQEDDDNLFEPDESFAEFAEKMGATELPDLLEAAAAYSAFVEGQKHFSRPQLMKRVASFEANESFTREAGLRSFGQLLRQGKIQKLKRGQFTIREDSRFRPEARIAGE